MISQYVQEILKEKEIIVANHILTAATDGCECEPCQSARKLLERDRALARLDEAKEWDKLPAPVNEKGLHFRWRKERIAELELAASQGGAGKEQK